MKSPDDVKDAPADEAPAAPTRRESMNETRFQVHNANVIGQEEERDENDKVTKAAAVHLAFEQHAQFAHATIVPPGNVAQAVTTVLVSEYIARNLTPETAIELGEYMAEEGRRVAATRKEQPLVSDKLVIAAGAGDVEAAAKAKEQVDALATPTTH